MFNPALRIDESLDDQGHADHRQTGQACGEPQDEQNRCCQLDASRKGRGKETDTAKEERVVMVLGSGGAAVGGAKHRTPGHTCRRLFCNVLLSMAAFRWAERGMKHGAG